MSISLTIADAIRSGRHAAELRYLVAPLAVVALIIGVGAGWWASPYGPAAVEAPAASLAAGDPSGAVDGWIRLADGWGPSDVREEALWRASLVSAVELDDPQRSAELFRRYIRSWPMSERVPEAHARLAGIYLNQMDDPLRAGENWRKAAADGGPRAAGWLLQAGQAYAIGGQLESASDALRGAALDPGHAESAWLTLARLQLSDDPAGAYEAYDAALRVSADGPGAALARLGMATALERLEGRDAALAQLDEAIADGDGDAAVVRRRHRLRNTP